AFLLALVADRGDHHDALADRVTDGGALLGDLVVLAEGEVDHVGAVVGGVPDAARHGVVGLLGRPVAGVAGVLRLADHPDGQDAGLRGDPDHAVAAAGAVAVPGDQRRHRGAVQARGGDPGVDLLQHVRPGGDRPPQIRLVRVDAGVDDGDGHAPALGDLPGGLDAECSEHGPLP